MAISLPPRPKTFAGVDLKIDFCQSVFFFFKFCLFSDESELDFELDIFPLSFSIVVRLPRSFAVVRVPSLFFPSYQEMTEWRKIRLKGTLSFCLGTQPDAIHCILPHKEYILIDIAKPKMLGQRAIPSRNGLVRSQLENRPLRCVVLVRYIFQCLS